ncbi:MAG: TMEM43 family protein [Salinivirgaceae bacterium]|nr:TMEM43 family protein [Salinivirgaceae bacterium]
MAYTETTTVGYGSRITNSVKGILSGFLLLIIGTVLLWWNEGRAVKTAKSIKNAVEQTTPVASLDNYNQALNGQMICASGFAKTDDYVSDPFFGIGETAIRIERKVEFFQWVEHSQSKTEDKVGGKQETTTTYTYSKEWTSSYVNSSEFKDADYQNKNFVLMSNVENADFQAKNVTVGAYILPEGMISSISGSEPIAVNLPADKIADLNKTVAQTLSKGDSLNFVSVTNNQIYLGENPNNPAIGDIKITFTKVMPATVTIWARVVNNTFEHYVDAKHGKGVGGLYMGTRSLDSLQEQAESSNNFMTWLLRIVGFLLVFFGLKGLFGLLIAILKVLPFLANIANVAVSIVCGVVGFAWSLVIIAIAWLFYRPILAGILIAVVVGLFIFLSKRSKEAKAPAEQSAETPAQA